MIAPRHVPLPLHRAEHGVDPLEELEELVEIAHPLRTPEGRLIADAASDDRGLGALHELPLALSRLREQPLEVARGTKLS